jgi:ankyrin repeat protein
MEEAMFNFLKFMIILGILFVFQSLAFSQSYPTTPTIRNYKEYLLMINALNDVNREKGLPSVKPLTKKEWERIYKQKPTVYKNGEKELLDAAFNGDKEKVNLLLNQGVNPEAKASDEGTPLMYAALKGHIDVVKALMDKGAKVNARDRNRCTALMQAASNGNVEVVKILLKAGADPNAIANDGTTALKWAKLKNYNDVVGILNEAGAKR